MAIVSDRSYRPSFHPFHAFLAAAAVPLFLGALLSDIAYSRSYELQWKNFASWLIPGGLVFAGFALLWALILLFRPDGRRGRPVLYFLLLLVTWILGLVNAFVHAKDAWASMPAALILSAIVAVLAIAVAVLGFSAFRGWVAR